ncbi:MAG: bifunctional pyr operon transcriptional regulator/uracil phosphoribosyltransferase PyrR [Flavobacteriaceae bacterium]|jgi:pyrimidine operon attenuation protein/uracil phosphoribosyltransferase|nr:bifunctional pyr operon transcriptional regulator/uracil phosphoribosyltransferase PyrR [Flavobacteriaceae bacterium]MBT4313302.1 bifunctional pyr operon transcriptional regulator/uracil phosphoribosyltransferase PyrR [Flavobacteriaceae bacterium]MBT5091313.1 bifunctional pyr operon transcriptional regulator/uracil phosphoribosyltransferase PyrR [Flavobacteriaceae bacterium]MBT5284170.1 bifunctional pyr operon transcriptional regulator/uracil phosphoribosyltransferase PyrR [Flavobacteriaceae |tara:strand:- start:1642 stop:2184 length:543 start_codon:yes stop_codon:yes gene_type:complete
MTPKVLLSEKRVNIMLNRLCCQLIERHGDFSNTVLVGLQPRGVLLLDQLILLLNENGVSSIQKGKLDTTFFRDDFRRSEVPHNAKATEMEVSIEGKNVVLIDDVLFTGRSIRSALTAIDSYGRPESIELLVLVDRRFSRHLPIQPDYLGAQIDALQGDKVKVVWSEGTANNIVYLEKQNQ